MPGPSADVTRHLSAVELAAAIDEAQSAGRARLVRRLCFVRNLYEGDSISEAARRVGVSQPTGSRWRDAWNGGGVASLEPEFGTGRPPKLSARQREQLVELLEEYPPLTLDEIDRLLSEGFGVSYSRRHLTRLLERYDLDDAVGGTSREEETGSNLQAALATLAADEREPSPTDSAGDG